MQSQELVEDNPVLKAALDYASLGWHVLPLIPKGKIPASKNGLKDASTDRNVLETWFKADPTRNLGIRTGTISGIVVVDIDKKSNGIESWNALVESLNIDVDTRTIETQGGGYHLYFKAPKDVLLRNRTNIRPGIDLRAEDGYVVAPPSHGYSLSYPGDTELSEIPPQLLEILLEKTVTPSPSPLNGSGLVVEGGRNHYLTQVAGKLQRSNLLTIEALSSVNLRDCSPPLSVWEVGAIFESVSRYQPKESLAHNQTGNEPVPGATGAAGDLEPLTVSAVQYVDQMLEGLKDKDKVRGTPTGIEGLDRMLGGGLREKELIFLSATAKTGKSSLLIQLIYNLISKGIPVGFASAEMEAASEILPSLLSIEFGENAWLEDVTELHSEKYRKALEKWPLHFLGNYGVTPIDRFERWVKDCKQRGVKYFFADHLHFLCENSEDFKEVAKYARTLKKLTITEEINLVLVVQPSQIADGQQLDMHKLRGGSSLSQVMNALLIMERYRDPNNNFKPVSNVVCLKLDAARSKLARPGSIYLIYNPDTTEILEAEPKQVETKPKGPILETEE